MYMRKEIARLAIAGSLTLVAAGSACAYTVETNDVGSVVPLQATAFSEGFENINTLAGNGWAFANLSNPGPVATDAVGNWLQGNPTAFNYNSQNAPAGGTGANAYIAGDVSVTDINQTDPFATASEWLFTPEIEFGGFLNFYTRTAPGNNRAEFLEVRASTSGASTNVGTNALSVGDFTTVLLEIGSATDPTAYPGAIAATNDWALNSVNTSALTGSGRIAFRWFGTNAGPVPSFDATPTNANVGIDTVSYAIPEPASSGFAAALVLVGAGSTLRRSRKDSRQQRPALD